MKLVLHTYTMYTYSSSPWAGQTRPPDVSLLVGGWLYIPVYSSSPGWSDYRPPAVSLLVGGWLYLCTAPVQAGQTRPPAVSLLVGGSIHQLGYVKGPGS